MIDRKVSVCDQCEICPKKERYKIVYERGNGYLPNPARLMMIESPLCVMVTESTLGDRKLILHRCLDPMCLLKNVKDTMFHYWYRTMQDECVKDMQIRSDRNRRKRNRKNR